MDKLKAYMVQYGVWPNCCNECDFCLRENRIPVDAAAQIKILDYIRANLNHIDWSNRFAAGISLLGGELYHIVNADVQQHFMMLIDDICTKVLSVSGIAKYSTVTNGLYEPSFLYRVIDAIVDRVGISHVDMNFSYDLKYRYRSEQDRLRVIDNINAFHARYNYRVGVQMILTQYVIDSIFSGRFDLKKFLTNDIQGNNFCFLYPHKIRTGKTLADFNFTRQSFLKFITWLKSHHEQIFLNFVYSTKHSALFKYTGYHDRSTSDVTQQPILCDDKEIINPKCGHSVLYSCYADTSMCMMCDIENLAPEINS